MTPHAVSIGQAAALYGLAPSTVRWWERQGVLTPPARNGGRRRYDDRDLRRIGVAYLCRVVGRMPLEQAAVVTSGQATLDAWQRTVADQITALDQQVERLEAARAYLRHLLRCEDDDMARCPVLEGELTRHTPRGRLSDLDLVTAARAAHAGTRPLARDETSPDTLARDETPSDPRTRDETPPAGPARTAPPTRCAACRAPLPHAPRGRPRTYCSRACQQRAYRARRAAGGTGRGPDRPDAGCERDLSGGANGRHGQASRPEGARSHPWGFRASGSAVAGAGEPLGSDQ
ncbi:MerR family transcriptional regulator [Streptomyces sp. NPDC057702]|uniref:MerR family transcriptional regulator n=1 Tax=unclassified Streptomyces TaxID=2593676 RepID=UPI0036AC0FFD